MQALTNIYQNVHSSKEFNRLGYGVLAGLFAAYVRLYDFRNTALLINHSPCLLGPVYIEVDQSHLGPMPSKEYGSRSAISYLTCR